MRQHRPRNKPLSKDEVHARQENSKKSTGPRTEMGKERVRANALKAGYHADKIAYQAMILLGEDPKEYAATFATLYEDMAPQNGGQVQMVEDVAVIRWQLKRNQRGQAGLIGQQIEALNRRTIKQWKTYEQTVEDTPQEEVIAHGIASLPDSKGKFERIMDLLGIAFKRAEKGHYEEADTVLTMIYGKESDSVHTARLRGLIEELTQAEDGSTVKLEKKLLLKGLNAEQLKWNAAWQAHLETMRPPSQAELNACFVPKGKAWRRLMQQAASLDQRLDKKMRLYWDTQEKDRERIVRRHEEAKLEATPEEEAAEQEAKAFNDKLMGLIAELDAKLKANAEAREAASAGETLAGDTVPGSAGRVGSTPPQGKSAGETVSESASESNEAAETSAANGKTIASTDSQSAAFEAVEALSECSSESSEKAGSSTQHGKTTASTHRQKATREATKVRSWSGAESPVDYRNKAGELTENKGAASEDKADTEVSPGD